MYVFVFSVIRIFLGKESSWMIYTSCICKYTYTYLHACQRLRISIYIKIYVYIYQDRNVYAHCVLHACATAGARSRFFLQQEACEEASQKAQEEPEPMEQDWSKGRVVKGRDRRVRR